MIMYDIKLVKYCCWQLLLIFDMIHITPHLWLLNLLIGKENEFAHVISELERSGMKE